MSILSSFRFDYRSLSTYISSLVHRTGNKEEEVDLTKPELSVICVFHNQKEWLEPTLNALYSIRDLPCEFIFIDDGSDDGSDETLRTLVDRYDADRSFIFINEYECGRGSVLNLALDQVNGQVLWIPDVLRTVDEVQLSKAVQELKTSGAPFAISRQKPIPQTASDWLRHLEENNLPPDRDFLFNLQSIRPEKRFIDPHWASHHASEWAIRIQSGSAPVKAPPFADGEQDISPDDHVKMECVLSLIRTSSLPASELEKAFRLLQSFERSGPEADTGADISRLSGVAETVGDTPEAEEGVADPESDFRNKPDPVVESESETEPESETTIDPDPAFDSKPVTDSRPESELKSTIESSPESETKSTFVSGSGSEPGSEPEPGSGSEPESESKSRSAPGPESGPDSYSPKSASEYEEEIRKQLPLSIIIPTSTNRRPMLEKSLASVFRFTSPEQTRLIIIDNGSVDDTTEYLARLLQGNVSTTVLTNDQNLGFAAAVNQGLAKAGDGTVLVMHNDVVFQNPVPARLAMSLERNPDIGLIAPKADQTWNKIQQTDHNNEPDTVDDDSTQNIGSSQNINDNNGDPYIEVDILDGYCMAFRNEPGLTMSKQYGLAYFEDADFCMRIEKKGFRVVVDTSEAVQHHSGCTTGDLGLTLYSTFYWKNSALFHNKWNIEPRFPANKTTIDPIHQFVIIGDLINPFYPEKHLLDYFEELFTSEQKTRIFHAEFPPDALKALIRLMMAANQREMLRRLEEQLDPLPPDIPLYHDLIAFYFERTIYSRCKRYLDKLEPSGLPVDFAIFRLKIAIGEKDYQNAATLLKELMDRIPTHPEVLLSAAEIHRRNGNREQSEKFVKLAKSFNPYLSNQVI